MIAALIKTFRFSFWINHKRIREQQKEGGEATAEQASCAPPPR